MNISTDRSSSRNRRDFEGLQEDFTDRNRELTSDRALAHETNALCSWSL